MNYPKNTDTILSPTSTPQPTVAGQETANPETFAADLTRYCDELHQERLALISRNAELQDTISDLQKELLKAYSRIRRGTPTGGEVAIAVLIQRIHLEQKTIDSAKRAIADLEGANKLSDLYNLQQQQGDLKAAQTNLRAWKRLLGQLQSELEASEVA